jgi:hypothetical protein
MYILVLSFTFEAKLPCMKDCKGKKIIHTKYLTYLMLNSRNSEYTSINRKKERNKNNHYSCTEQGYWSFVHLAILDFQQSHNKMAQLSIAHFEKYTTASFQLQ